MHEHVKIARGMLNFLCAAGLAWGAVVPARANGTDPAGPPQRGVASVYSHSLAGRKMADGQAFHPGDHVAASKTLPLGAHAVVTNLRNGRQADVKVADRGPYVRGRIIDLSPAAAHELGVHGTAPVTVQQVKRAPPETK